VDAAFAEAQERIELQAAEVGARSIELAGRERRIEELERVATWLSERVVEREGELRQLRAELASRGAESDAQLASLTALMGELEELRRTARGQATRIRLRALRDAAELSERLGELTKKPAGMRERLLDALTEAIARISGEEEPEPEAPETRPEFEPAPAATNGHAEREVAAIFEGLIEVEIGPLSDFAQLVGFEDAAKSIGETTDITVKRFSDGRATLKMSLSEPVALLAELEERSDLEFAVRDMRRDRVILDVDDE
jgi:hypothetical protein